MKSTGLISGVRRGWAVVQPRERKRLRRVALFGVVIAALDAFALVLIFALINLLNDQRVGGVAGSFVDALGVGPVRPLPSCANPAHHHFGSVRRPQPSLGPRPMAHDRSLECSAGRPDHASPRRSCARAPAAASRAQLVGDAPDDHELRRPGRLGVVSSSVLLACESRSPWRSLSG